MKVRDTLAQWLAKLASHSANQLQVEWEEEDKMLKLGTPQPVVLAGNLNSTGTITGNSATGTVPVTEASAASINLNVGYMASEAGIASQQGPIAGAQDHVTALGVINAGRHRIYTVPINIAAGGALTNIVLHATLAGYKFHFEVLGIVMSVSDATTTWWFHSTAGAVDCIGCPATPGFSPINLTASTVNTQLAGAYMNNPAATGDVTLLDVAGVGAGAATGFIYLEGWFEAT